MEEAFTFTTSLSCFSFSFSPILFLFHVYHYRLTFVIFKIHLLTNRAFSHMLVFTAIFIPVAIVISCLYTHAVSWESCEEKLENEYIVT